MRAGVEPERFDWVDASTYDLAGLLSRVSRRGHAPAITRHFANVAAALCKATHMAAEVLGGVPRAGLVAAAR